MKLTNNKFTTALFIVLCTISILYAYQDITKIFYMHDEWVQLSGIQINGLFNAIQNLSSTQIILGVARPLGTLLNNIILYLFPYNTTPYIIIFLLLHIINSILVYFVSKKFTKNLVISLVAGLFFASTSIHQEALSWIGAGIQILFSFLFLLLGLMCLFKYLRKKHKIWLFLTPGCIYISFLFKEVTLPFILFFIVVSCYEIKKLSFKKVFYTYGFVITALIGIGFYRIIDIYQRFIAHGVSGNQLVNIEKGLFNTVYYPLVSLSQNFIPYRFMFRLGYWFMGFNYSFMKNDYNVESIVHHILSDMFSITVSLLLIGLLIFIYTKNKNIRKAILYGSIFYFLSFIPIAFASLNRYGSYIESRYMYFQSFGVALIVGSIIYILYLKIMKWKRYKIIGQLIFFVFLILLLVKQCVITKREVNVNAIYGAEMKSFLAQYRLLNLVIPDKPIYFIRSDKSYIYPENKLPFLLNGGFIFMTIEYPSDKIPSILIREEYLKQFGEGYREIKNQGFGYFTDMQTLVQFFLENQNVDQNQLIGLYYRDSDRKLINITDEAKKELTYQLNKYGKK